MEIDWYFVFMSLVLVLWAFASPRDRNALRIVLIASLASEVVVDGITCHINGAAKLAIPGCVEILTIIALLKWANNRTGIMQSGLLVIAWLDHFLCYLDCLLKTDIVYSRYESILLWVSVGQLAAFYDTLFFNFRRFWDKAAAWADGVLGILAPRRVSGYSLVSADKALPKVKGQGASGIQPTIGAA
jgi:hypothetical protein